jgi:hypothetical protein
MLQRTVLIIPLLLYNKTKEKKLSINFQTSSFLTSLHILHLYSPSSTSNSSRPSYCNVLGGSIHDGTLLHSKSQYTTVKYSWKLFEHTSNLYGPRALIPIGFFQQDLLWQSSNTHSHSCSQEASKHTRSIRHRAIGPLAHHNGTSAHSPSLACPLPAPTIECLHRPS